MNKKFVRKLVFNTLLLSVPLAMAVSSLSWFEDSSKTSINMSSQVYGQYFNGGDGSSSAPFKIKYPTQLYYLAWLQEMGYFNMPEKDNNGDETGNIKQTYFILEDDIDFFDTTTQTNYILPPIGTAKYPFIGNFDGNGKTISNLNIQNADCTLPPDPNTPFLDDNAPEIIGFFGVIGTLAEPTGQNGAYQSSDYSLYARDEQKTDGSYTSNTYTYNNSVVSVRNFTIKDCNIKTQTSNALVGIAAGYVNGSVSGVAVKNSNLSVNQGTSALSYTNNISDYSIVGYARDQYINERTLDPRSMAGISVPGGTMPVTIEDAGNQWGGSVDMKSMFNNLTTIRSKASQFQSGTNNVTNPQYLKAVTRTIDEVNGTDVTNKEYGRMNDVKQTAANGSNRSYVQSDFCSINFYNNHDSFIYLYGPNDQEQAKTITEITYKDEYDNNAFYISSGSNYLSLNSSHTGITNTTSVNSSTKWRIDNSNNIFTTLDGEFFYLTLNGMDLTLNSDASSYSKWSKKTNGIFYTVNSTDYAKIVYDNGWKCSAISGNYICAGNNYLTLTSTSTFGNTTNIANATKWTFSDSTNMQGTISGTYSNQTVYLRNNSGTLQVSSTSTTWSNNGSYIYNGNYRLSFSRQGVWTLLTSLNASPLYTISCNGNYLSNSSTNITNATTSENATKWAFGTTGTYPSGNCYVSISNRNYYLRINQSSLALNTSISYSTSNDNGILKRSNNDYYVRLNGTTWTATNSLDSATKLTFTPYYDTYAAGSKFSNSDLTLTTTTKQIETRDVYTRPSGLPTYYPLSIDVGSNNAVSVNPANTGYVVSGGMSAASSSGRGDIRVSSYAIGNINGAYSSGSSDFSKTNSNYNVQTINDSGDHKITSTEANNFEKFNESKTGLIDVLKTGSNVYGLHFMKTEVSINNIVEADQVTINNQTYNDSNKKYQLPMDSIDFNLGSKGYLNFFAGTYYSNNKSFFSLHKIFRDESGFEITDIKEIDSIYGNDDDDDFIYKYTDGTYSDILTSDYSVIFKTSWIKTRNSLTSNTIYYFEIPVNEGEYALGSDPDSDGAYLLYLDISANKQIVQRTYYVDTVLTTTDTVRTPNGVAFVKDDFDDPSEITINNTATYQLGAGYYNATITNNVLSGYTNFNRTENTTLDTDQILLTKSDSTIDSDAVATFVGFYEENDETKDIYSNPPGSDIPYTPYRREYISSYQITYSDENKQTGTTKTVITCYDTVITYLSGEEYITRVIKFDVYNTAKGDTVEKHLFSCYTDSIADTEKINFTYSLSAYSDTYYFSLLYNDMTSTNKTLTSHITLMNGDGLAYNFSINGNTVSGNPTEANPINFNTSETITDFETLFLTMDDYDPDNQGN